MTDEFLKRVKDANEIAIQKYKKEKEEYNIKLNANKLFAEQFMKLIIAFIEKYDYANNSFVIDYGIKKLVELIGTPESIKAYIDDFNRGIIRLEYRRNNELKLTGLPSYINNPNFDLNMICELLRENDIRVIADLWDCHGRGNDEYIISFDASILVNTRNELLNDSISRR